MLLMILPVFSQPDSTQIALENSRSILLAQGNSYFELLVAKRVESSLLQKGYMIKIINLKYLNNESPRNYKAFIFFNTVKTNRLLPFVKAYQSMAKNRNPNARFLICDVYGRDWSQRAPNTDATTSATSSIDPEKVADNVVENTMKVMSDTTRKE
jgi:hypothetical protein